MNNRDAWNYLSSKESVRAATRAFVQEFQLDENEMGPIRYKFSTLKTARDSSQRSKVMEEWEEKEFYTFPCTHPSKKRILQEKMIVESDLSMEQRKPLSQITLKAIRTRLNPLLNLIDTIAQKEEVEAKTIATYALMLISNVSKDVNTSNVCKEIISKGTFGNEMVCMPIDKSAFLLDLLEIGCRKYTNFKRLCKSERISFPSYSKVALYRQNVNLTNELVFVHNELNTAIGIAISYRQILHQSLLRLFEIIPPLTDSQYPLTINIADGLDGSGCHQIYNQYELNPTPNTKNYILFAFKLLSIQDSANGQIWTNNVPNSQFGVRPVLLTAQKECIDSVKFIMDKIINPEVKTIEQEGLYFTQGHVQVKITRSMLDGKMCGILSGAGGARCQLCTASIGDTKDIEMVRGGFPINRHISDAKEIFAIVDEDDFLSLRSSQRFGLTHEPLSDINIMAASPLHSYTCVFRWYMLLLYHLQAGKSVWKPTSPPIETARKFCSEFLHEKTGLRIDQPSSDGGTSSTGNIARQCFMNKNDFNLYACSLIPPEFREKISVIQNNLSAILRIYNCSHEIQTDKLESLSKETYELILTSFPWANITPSLHKLLAHCTELIRECNNGYGLKEYSEEALESCNKLIRRFREHLSRKNSFTSNIRDVFTRLLSQSDPVLSSYRRTLVCKTCGEIGHIRNEKCKGKRMPSLDQEQLVDSLMFNKLSI